MKDKITISGSEFTIPWKNRWIGSDAEDLYEAEEDRKKAIAQCAEEWLYYTKTPKSEYWSTAIPRTLYDTLQSYQAGAATAAAVAYLHYVLNLHGLDAAEREAMVPILEALLEAAVLR